MLDAAPSTAPQAEPLPSDPAALRPRRPPEDDDSFLARLEAVARTGAREDDLSAPKWKLIEALSMEFLGEYQLPEAWPPPAPGARSPEVIAAARALVEASNRAATSQAAAAPPQAPAAAPQAPGTQPSPPAWPRPKPRRLLRELKRLVADRIPDDERLGRACFLVRRFAAWKVTDALGFDTFCTEHLGLAPSTVRQLRDRGRCQVPGCSARAAHLHHVRFRSHGGSDAGWNRTAVCSAHHLAGIHQGYIVVTGTAPDGLTWQFPGRDGPDEPEAEA